MNQLTMLWFVASLAVSANYSDADPSTQPSPRIATFAGDRAAAISYTFDDNLRDQYTVARPMLNDVGFKATFFVIAGKTADTPEEGDRRKEDGNPRNLWGGISWPELKKLSDEGHEIASHTWSHPALTKLSGEDLDAQFSKAYDAIKTHIGKPPLTVAFPGNASNAEVQAAGLKHHLAYRAFQQSTSGKSTVASLNAWADRLVTERQWGILMVHGISRGYAALQDPAVLKNHLEYVRNNAESIWVDTFLNISRYRMERENAKISSSLGLLGGEFTLHCDLDPNIFDEPLTVILPVSGAKSVVATGRTGASLRATMRADAILVDVTPGDGVVKVSWSRGSEPTQ